MTDYKVKIFGSVLDPRVKDELKRSGIIGIRTDIRTKKFFKALKKFSILPQQTKEKYKPSGNITGYEKGVEKFYNVDLNKASYYALYPDNKDNIWPDEVNLRDPFLNLSKKMFRLLVDLYTLLFPQIKTNLFAVGRMLHYSPSSPDDIVCSPHFDHGVLTALIRAEYGSGDPSSDLYVEIDGEFKRIVVEEKNVVLLQAGEFSQIMSNDTITATKHLVKGNIQDRYTLALFLNADPDLEVDSTSLLKRDPRYGRTFGEWHLNSLKKYK